MKTEVEAVFLFIAELTGSFVPGSGNVNEKIMCGKTDYLTNHLPKLDLANEEDRKDLHELVWLERLYKELDNYFGIDGTNLMRYLAVDGQEYRQESYRWTVPIECDASASMLQYMGLLLNDKRLMEMTNIIGDTLQDPWKLEGMPRQQLKKAATPMLYASSKAAHELWQDAGIKYTSEHIAIYTREMADGAFGIANLLKEFIVNNAQPRAKMMVKVWGETFQISCNRFRYVGEKTKAYKAWDSIDQQYNIVLHTETKKVPDLEQFRRYFVTLLVHHLDSRVADVVIGKTMAKYGWGIPIHDAFLVSPAAAADVRKWYAEELTKIYNDRKTILKEYFASIGVNAHSAQQQWNDLKSKIVPLEGDLVVNHMALK